MKRLIGNKTDLWCEIVRRTTQRPSGTLAVLRETKVGDLDVTVVCEQDVLGLEVTVDEIVCV